MYKTRRIKLDKSYYSYILYLVRELQHLRNILIIIRENTKNDFVRNNILNYMVIRSMIAGTNNERAIKLRRLLNKEFPELLNSLLEDFNHISNKLIVSKVKELRANYNTNFGLYKKGIISSFKMHTKKLSKVNEGSVIVDSNNVYFKDNYFKLLIYSRKHDKGMYFLTYCNIDNISHPIIKNCIISVDGFDAYLQFSYKIPDLEIKKIENPKYMSIDVGAKNHLTIFMQGERSLIIRNSAINRIGRLISKFLPKFDSLISKLKNNSDFGNKFKRLVIRKKYLFNMKNIIAENEIHKIVNRMIDCCKKFNITHIILGRNLNLKKGCNLGHKNNKKLYLFPHYKFLLNLKYRCLEEGIILEEQEESYTSKLSCISDKVWKFPYQDRIKPTESSGLRGIIIKGKKIYSLFKDNLKNMIIHSDINGAINILQKYLSNKVEIYKDQLCNPIIIRNDFDFLNFLA